MEVDAGGALLLGCWFCKRAGWRFDRRRENGSVQRREMPRLLCEVFSGAEGGCGLQAWSQIKGEAIRAALEVDPFFMLISGHASIVGCMKVPCFSESTTSCLGCAV